MIWFSSVTGSPVKVPAYINCLSSDSICKNFPRLLDAYNCLKMTFDFLAGP